MKGVYMYRVSVIWTKFILARGFGFRLMLWALPAPKNDVHFKSKPYITILLLFTITITKTNIMA